MSKYEDKKKKEKNQGDPGPPPLFLDQTEARRAEKKFLETAPTPLI